ncbi:MAG TPA: gluconeogenesis factor YvcK family protein [Candidatus Saccharimonadales bacterium]|nr:gluconeogenesis factor YvcK family protein [Candidatus Saccharimonadales bacterium]
MVEKVAQTDPKVVIIGGGTGSFALLSGFKKYTSNLTAIVNMADDGSSSGILRDELGVLPPGDARRCLVALSDSPRVRELFEYRYDEGPMKGHAFGNIFLATLEKLTGSFAEAIDTASEVLNIRGRVVPATLDDVRLRLSWPHKQLVLHGERVIDVEYFKYDPRSAKLSLEPQATANPAALTAIMDANLVVIAPGDLYTSLGPILIADGMKKALNNTKARIVYVCNLVTKVGQTDGFDVSTHASEIERFIGKPVIDTVLYNTGMPTENLLKKYAKVGEHWVRANTKLLEGAHYDAIGGDFVAHNAVKLINKSDPLTHHRTFIRHDAGKVARRLLQDLN